jgi:hypothetical protein
MSNLHNLNQRMNKLVILFVIIGCGLALHAQRYPPSTPGGNYQQGNGTQPTSNYGSGQVTPLVNGQVYRYTGPFTLACWLPNNTNAPYRYDTCRS